MLLDAVETGVSWGGRAVQLGAYAHGCWTGATTTLMKGGVPLNPRTLALKAIAGCGTGLAGVYATEKTFEHSVAPVLALGVEYAAHGVGRAVGSAAYLATGDGLFSEEVARIGTRAMGAVTGAYFVSRGARAFFHPNPLMERMTGESIVKIFDAAASARARVGYIESRVAVNGNMLLLEAPDIIRHHLFNKFRGESIHSQKYRDFFKVHGIEIDKYTIEIPASMHRSVIHSASKDWTNRWRLWIDSNPHATTKEVYQHAGILMDEYKVSHLPIISYSAPKRGK